MYTRQIRRHRGAMAAMGAVPVLIGTDAYRSPPIYAPPILESDAVGGGYPITTGGGVAVPAGTLSPPLIGPSWPTPVLRTAMTPAPMPPSVAATVAMTPSGSPEMPKAPDVDVRKEASAMAKNTLGALGLMAAATAAAILWMYYDEKRSR